jgi:hypothetical protein
VLGVALGAEDGLELGRALGDDLGDILGLVVLGVVLGEVLGAVLGTALGEVLGLASREKQGACSRHILLWAEPSFLILCGLSNYPASYKEQTGISTKYY